MEIDENLQRAELSPSEKAMHIRRRQEVWESINGPAKAIGGRASAAAQGKSVEQATPESGVAFTTDTATSTGRAASTIRQVALRGRELGPDLSKIAGTSLDKGVEMDALIKMDEPERPPVRPRQFLAVD